MQLIGTKSKVTTTFTDNRYTKSRTYDEYLLFYDLRAYYSTEGTYSNPYFIAIYGGPPFQKSSDTTLVEQVIPKEYSLSNYPNPFNPNTTIRYQLPKAGHVQIKVYDAIGKEVTTLVNEHLESGRYEARFGENNLPSGMYIYTIKVNDYFASKKMLLIK